MKPKMSFKQVLDKYGYPVVSKEQSRYIYDVRHTKSDKLRKLRLEGGTKGAFKISNKWKYLLDAPFKISGQCCDKTKKEPMKTFTKQNDKMPIIGTMADESQLRLQSYTHHGCNGFDMKAPQSRPIMFWKEEDVWEYIRKYELPYSSIYDMGVKRTGCIFCMFGVHLEKQPNRFQKLQKSHPKHYKYCMEKLGLKEILKTLNVPSEWNAKCEFQKNKIVKKQVKLTKI